jgi:hypothetical protein
VLCGDLFRHPLFATESTWRGWRNSKSGSWSGGEALCARRWSSAGQAP